jgi:glycosyltransferase involved in cell wall biosynthesis
MRIAFHAPMKAPDHRVPSGDRTMARLLVATLTAMGHEVELASRLRAYDGKGDTGRQRRIAERALREVGDLERRWRDGPPDLWFTYHLYHKAPDHLGPRLAETFGLPYVVAEPSIAPKQRGGPWGEGYAHALAALARADALMPVTREDADGLHKAGIPRERIVPLTPFVDTAPYQRHKPALARKRIAERYGLDAARPLAVVVAMMRPGDKMASYRVLADAMEAIAPDAMDLLIVGDGPGRDEIEARLGSRARFAGNVAPRSLPAILAGCDLFLWPAVNEAYGMALLAAQAAGLPLVAGAARGVPEIAVDGRTALLTPEGDAAAFARAVRRLLDDPLRRAAMGAAAGEHVALRHSMASASLALDRAITQARHAR